MPIGTCALCRQPAVTIRDSHLLAAGFYRRVTGESGKPVLVNSRSIVETSERVKAHLLCDDCERRFKDWEDWVLAVCWRAPGDFPLLEVLAGAPTLSKEGYSDRGFDGRAVSAARIDDVARFGASVFWRAGARRWPQLDDDSQIRLGRYLEPLRRYLLGELPFPDGMALHVLLTGDPTDGTNHAIALPYQAGRTGFRLYRFEVPGISFALLVGRETPANNVRFCACRTASRSQAPASTTSGSRP